MLDSSKLKHLKTKRLCVFFFNLQTVFDSDYVWHTHHGIFENVFWVFSRYNWRRQR